MMLNTWHKLNMLQKYLQTPHWICPNTDLVSESIFLLILQLGTQTFCLSVVVIKHTCRIVIFTWTSVSSVGLRRMTFIWGQKPWWGGGASVRRDFAWISFYQSSFRYNTCLDQSIWVCLSKKVPLSKVSEPKTTPDGAAPSFTGLFVHICVFQSVTYFANKLNSSISFLLCFLLLHVICMQIKLPRLALQSAHPEGKHGIFIYLQNTLFPFFLFCANKAEFSLSTIWSILAKLTMKDYCVQTNGVLHLFPLTALWFKYYVLLVFPQLSQCLICTVHSQHWFCDATIGLSPINSSQEGIN